MAYPASIYRVFIASSGLLRNERDALSAVIHEWNEVHATDRGIFLEPVRWEVNATPDMSASGQDVINRDLLDKCDMLVAIFWYWMGAPTLNKSSGTEEEIERFIAAGKTVMLYFCEAPVPYNHDREQYDRVLEYKKKRGFSVGLSWRYNTIDELRDEFRKHLARKLLLLPKSQYLTEKQVAIKTSSLWAGKLGDALIREPTSLRIFQKDGYTFYDTRKEVLKQRLADPTKKTKVLILHPDYKHMEAVADMDPRKRGDKDKQRADCLTAVKSMHEIRAEILSETSQDIASRVEFIGFRLVPTWNGFISEKLATIHLYPTIPYRGDLKTLEIPASDDFGRESEWYEKYMTEYNEIVRLTREEGPSANLWTYKMESIDSRI